MKPKPKKKGLRVYSCVPCMWVGDTAQWISERWAWSTHESRPAILYEFGSGINALDEVTKFKTKAKLMEVLADALHPLLSPPSPALCTVCCTSKESSHIRIWPTYCADWMQCPCPCPCFSLCRQNFWHADPFWSDVSFTGPFLLLQVLQTLLTQWSCMWEGRHSFASSHLCYLHGQKCPQYCMKIWTRNMFVELRDVLSYFVLLV